METLKTLLQNRYVQLALALFVGITVGAVFYPTKSIEEKVKQTITQEYTAKIEELTKKHSLETQELSKKLEVEESSNRQYKEETTKKVQVLITENSQLKSSMKKRKFKLVKPDGTIVETEVEESNTEKTTSMVTQVKQEFTKKVSEIENKWKKIHEDLVASIKKENEEQVSKLKTENSSLKSELESSRTVETNKKKLRTEVGVTTNKDVYSHTSYSLWGPVFIGGGVSGTNTHFGDARLGLGIEL